MKEEDTILLKNKIKALVEIYQGFNFYISKNDITIVKDSPLMGKNLIHIRLVLLQTLARLCIRFTRRSLLWRILVVSI